MIVGFSYVREFLSNGEERSLLRSLKNERFEALRMRGQETRRSIVSYGLEFRPHVGTLTGAPPIPPYLDGVRRRAAALVGIHAADLEQALLTCYPDGSDIGWHIDHPSFGDTVIAVSLSGDAMLSLRRGRETHRLLIEARSAYVLRDVVRYEYQHKVTARSRRYSITLRPIATSAKRVG